MLAPWKKSYDKPRQHIKKQRHYFANKGPSNQSYDFSRSHIWMWELDYKESWAPKNWCFWTVVLEKTLESPLGCKEIKPVNSKGTQSWIFIGRTDAEAETPVLWPPDSKNWLIGKDSDGQKDWRQEEKGTTEDEMVGWYHPLNEHELGKLRELVMDRKPGVLQSMGSKRVGHDWVTELNIPLSRYTLFIHPSVNGYLGYFHFGAIINMSNAAVNIMYTFLCGQIFSVLLGIIYLGVKLLGHRAPLYLTFQGAAKLFSKAAAPFYNPTRIVTGF